MEKEIITFQDFVTDVQNGQYDIGIISWKVPYLRSSDLFNKKTNKIINVWVRSSIILILTSIILIFIVWKVALVILAIGLILLFGIKGSSVTLVREDMLKDEDFFHFVLSSGSALLKTKDGRALIYKNGQIIDYKF